MYVLNESQVNGCIRRLDEAWQGRETFAFVSEHGGVPEGWVGQALQRLTPDLATGHFALLSSGSTGQPKLVVGSRRRAERLARLLHDVQESRPVRETIAVLPLTYCYAFVNQWLWARVTGRTFRFTHGMKQPDRLREILKRSRDAMLCLIGAQLPLLRQSMPDDVFDGVIRVHFAGGAFPEKSLDLVRQLFPNARVYNNFGCAEAMPRLTVRPVHAGESNIGIGRPLPGVQLRTDDRQTLCFRSPFASVAEVNPAGLRRRGEWMSTGDLAIYDDHQEEWRVPGRAGEVFKRYGEKISTSSVLQSVQDAWPGQAALYREIDTVGEQAHVLVLSPAPDGDHLRGVLRRFRYMRSRAWWPLRVEGVAEMPLLPNGKPDVTALPDLPDKHILWQQRL